MAWTQEQIDYLKTNVDTMTYAQIGVVLNKHPRCVSSYANNRKMRKTKRKSTTRYRRAEKFVPTSDQKAKIALFASYIGYGISHGASPERAVEGAMSAIRTSGGLG